MPKILLSPTLCFALRRWASCDLSRWADKSAWCNRKGHSSKTRGQRFRSSIGIPLAIQRGHSGRMWKSPKKSLEMGSRGLPAPGGKKVRKELKTSAKLTFLRLFNSFLTLFWGSQIEQMDAEGLGRKLLLTPPPGDPRRFLKSRQWVLWQHLTKC